MGEIISSLGSQRILKIDKNKSKNKRKCTHRNGKDKFSDEEKIIYDTN